MIMKTIDLEQLATITGGVDWNHVHDRATSSALEGLKYGARVGAVAGGVAAGAPGSFLGLTAGAMAGFVGGAAYGAGRAIYDTWGDGSRGTNIFN
jgi:hypothetical protein